MSNTSDSATIDTAMPVLNVLSGAGSTIACSIHMITTKIPAQTTAWVMLGTVNRSRVRNTTAPRRRSWGSTNKAMKSTSTGSAGRSPESQPHLLPASLTQSQ